MKKVLLSSFLLSILLFGCTQGEFSQRLEDAANSWKDRYRVQGSPSNQQCPSLSINWVGERVALVLSRSMFSQEIQRQIVVQFGMRLEQRGAFIVDAPSAAYEMRIRPFVQSFVQGDVVAFQITVLNRAKRPVAYKFSQYILETPWLRLRYDKQRELINTMTLSAFVELCAGSPSWQW